jgi:hypothetical protein
MGVRHIPHLELLENVRGFVKSIRSKECLTLKINGVNRLDAIHNQCLMFEVEKADFVKSIKQQKWLMFYRNDANRLDVISPILLLIIEVEKADFV